MKENKKITADMIVSKAKEFEGVKESPANSNNVIFNTHYYGKPVKGAAYPWCCAFVWDVFRLCGASRLFTAGKRQLSVPQWRAGGKTSALQLKRQKGKKVILSFLILPIEAGHVTSESS